MSSISVTSRLLGSLNYIKSILNCYPNLKLVSNGTSLKYLSKGENENTFYIFYFSANSIRITTHSKDSPFYYMGEALLRLLSMLSTLEGIYEPDIRSIYPYLIAALGEAKLYRLIENLNEPIDPNFENSSDIVLARRINLLIDGNNKLTTELKQSNSMLESLLSKFITLHYGADVSIEKLSEETGLDKGLIEKMLGNMGKLGYKPIRAGKDRFSLVRL